MVFRESSNAEFIMRKFVPDLENDNLQGFINDELNKFKFLDTMCAVRSFRNVDKDNIKERLKVLHEKWASSK
jgi:hypothetical protein